jgi:hypothetical protein
MDYYHDAMPSYDSFMRTRLAARSMRNRQRGNLGNNPSGLPSSENRGNSASSHDFHLMDFLGSSDRTLSETSFNQQENCFSAFVNSSKELYGSLTIFTLKKILNVKLLKFTLVSERLYRKILEIYFNNLTQEKEDYKSMFKNTKLFISCLPTLKFIRKFILKKTFDSEKNKRNIYFVKLCLDIYEDYLKNFDFPLFRKYKNSFLDTAILFYSKLTNSKVEFINTQINIFFKNLSMIKFSKKIYLIFKYFI